MGQTLSDQLSQLLPTPSELLSADRSSLPRTLSESLIKHFRLGWSHFVDARERAYCSKLAASLNKSRELMGSPPVDPRNFAEVLESYFQGMAEVMAQGVSNTATSRGINKTSAKP